jgi:alcohol dehydrogenase
MRAMLTTAHGGLDKLRFESNFPEPTPGADEVLVRVAATALNYHDLFTRRGMPGIKIPLPLIVGSDIAGEIAALGRDVRGWRQGDRVLIDPIYRDGIRGMIGEASHGGRAEYALAPASQLIRVPEAVSLNDAACLPLAYGTAWRMMMTRGRVAAGETVLVLGASGGVGVACVQIAKLVGAQVTVCASSPGKIERLREIGADHAIDYVARDFREAVHDIHGKPRMSGSGGVDVAVNFTGGETWVDTQKCVKLGGRILTCGATAGYSLTMDARYLWTFEHRYLGSDGWATADLEALLSLLAENRLRPVIDRVLPLDEAADAERLLEDREVFGKVLLKL